MDAQATFPPHRTPAQVKALQDFENDPEAKAAFKFIYESYKRDMTAMLEKHEGSRH